MVRIGLDFVNLNLTFEKVQSRRFFRNSLLSKEKGRVKVVYSSYDF